MSARTGTHTVTEGSPAGRRETAHPLGLTNPSPPREPRRSAMPEDEFHAALLDAMSDGLYVVDTARRSGTWPVEDAPHGHPASGVNPVESTNLDNTTHPRLILKPRRVTRQWGRSRCQPNPQQSPSTTHHRLTSAGSLACNFGAAQLRHGSLGRSCGSQQQASAQWGRPLSPSDPGHRSSLNSSPGTGQWSVVGGSSTGSRPWGEQSRTRSPSWTATLFRPLRLAW